VSPTVVANADWTVRGLSLAESTEEEGKESVRPDMEEFHAKFDVVFLDSTGYVNLPADMTKSQFQWVSFTDVVFVTALVGRVVA